ncbi:MAG: metallophosphoesterase [Dehalobacterium sp.]
MDSFERLSQVFKSSETIPFNDSSRIVLISDCHRGDGSWADTFLKNQNLYYAALTHYYKERFTYIELGDGDELWENNNFYEIIHVHKNAYWLLSKFFNEGRLYFIFGNHDMIKKSNRFVKRNYYYYFDERKKKFFPIFKNIKFHEGLILKHTETKNKIFLLHGHQVDFFNDQMWGASRFLVRYFWRPLELFGVNDPTSTAKNYIKKQFVEKKLIEWVKKEKHMLIAGHTHRPVFPEVGEPPYFNDGSCVHPRCITAIEIADGHILLVKWNVQTKTDGTLFVYREILAGPRKLKEYFRSKFE